MNEAQTAEAVAAVWFTVFFGLALLVPAFKGGRDCLRSKAQHRRRDHDHK